jgi:hypothetical protein
MIGFNGGLIGKENPSLPQASNPGVWTAREQEVAKRAGRWAGQELLDTYTGSTAAFSLRPLRSATSSSNLVEVRRSTDSAVNNFTATQINNTGAGGMLAWVTETSATASGFVSTWYDQSGSNNHAVQADTNLQPRIVNAGALELDAGKPAIVFGSANGVCLSPPSIIMGATAAFFSVTRHTNAGSGFSFYIGENGTSNFFVGKTSGGSLAAYINNPSGISSTNIVQKTIAYWQLGTSISQYKFNGSGATLGDIVNSANWRIGTRSSQAGQMWIGPIQEIIYYPTSQVSTNSGIISALNTYYTVF